MADLSKATPRPWRLKTTGNINNAIEGPTGKSSYENDDGYRIVATYQDAIDSSYYADQQANREANAALIVKCVNLHDELVAALRLIAAFGGKTLIDATGARRYDEGAAAAFEQAADIAKSVLAKAEAE